MSEITIKNIGPIENVSIPLPDAGVVVLKGRNGRGKSHCLAAVDTAITGKGQLSVRDGQKQGKVDCLGVTLVVGRKTRKAGEAEVSVIDGSVSIAQLVDPGIKDPVSADDKRIKALVDFCGVYVSIEAFEDAANGKATLQTLVNENEEVQDSATIVQVAERLKRSAEAIARRTESETERLQGVIEAITANLESIGEIDVEGDPSAEFLGASSVVESLTNQLQAAQKDEEERQAAEQVLASFDDREHVRLKTAYEAAAKNVAQQEEQQAAIEKEIHSLEEKLDDLRIQKSQCDSVTDTRRAELTAAEVALVAQDRAIKTAGRAKERLTQPAVERPTSEAMQAAIEAQEAAKANVERVSEIERAKQQTRILEDTKEQRRQTEEMAKQYRDIAKAIPQALGAMLGGEWLVDEGRLYTQTDRGLELFSDLSHAERWEAAIRAAAPVVSGGDSPGLLTLPQEAWEGMDEVTRGQVNALCKELSIVILTAEAAMNDAVNPELY